MFHFQYCGTDIRDRGGLCSYNILLSIVAHQFCGFWVYLPKIDSTITLQFNDVVLEVPAFLIPPH